MKIIIGIAATGRYCYALKEQATRLLSALQTSPEHKYVIVFVGNEDSRRHAEEYRDSIGNAYDFEFICQSADDSKKNYGTDAQLVIAKLQGAYFHRARQLLADYCWSLEADVLPPANAVRVMLDALTFDAGFYDIAQITYPSQGGGGYLGGFGTPQHPIAQDVLPEERNIPEELLSKWTQNEQEAKLMTSSPSEEWIKARQTLEEEVRKCPPKGNVWELQGKHYRRRGWLDQAYPGVGLGAILPCDWVGLGCTMLSRKALALAHFSGYQGHGTQDLFLSWHRWHPAGLKHCVITHTLCDHVIRKRAEDGSQSTSELTLAHAYHEQQGEARGHLRIRHVPFFG